MDEKGLCELRKRLRSAKAGEKKARNRHEESLSDPLILEERKSKKWIRARRKKGRRRAEGRRSHEARIARHGVCPLAHARKTSSLLRTERRRRSSDHLTRRPPARIPHLGPPAHFWFDSLASVAHLA